MNRWGFRAVHFCEVSMREFVVHEEWDRIIVPARGHNSFYRVSRGTVNWSDEADDLRVAVTIFMQDDATEDFEEAKARGTIWFRKNAHVLAEDVGDVTRAMAELVARARRH